MTAVWTATVLAALVVILIAGWLWTWLQWRRCLRQQWTTEDFPRLNFPYSEIQAQEIKEAIDVLVIED